MSTTYRVATPEELRLTEAEAEDATSFARNMSALAAGEISAEDARDRNRELRERHSEDRWQVVKAAPLRSAR